MGCGEGGRASGGIFLALWQNEMYLLPSLLLVGDFCRNRVFSLNIRIQDVTSLPGNYTYFIWYTRYNHRAAPLILRSPGLQIALTINIILPFTPSMLHVLLHTCPLGYKYSSSFYVATYEYYVSTTYSGVAGMTGPVDVAK